MKVQHKKELKFYCFVTIPVVFVVLTVISFLLQEITFPVTASAFLNASWHNLLFLMPFGLFFCPVHIWMKQEFGRWNDAEKKRG
ncbi:hypothetical protein [Bacillus atrophaeus]|uniref:hypothetical protein n=1 Tax=Bacillus atrophaeus TaxID=1452 RepID=UPI000B45645D|nr:hypothetical protein [Bacillus atrophaeus]ARW08957.1 uncharacterized protein S101359_03979 [Bacillus atrophaeus]ASS73203.1 hypothetical protein BaGK_20745 [Bacillus atrophaeus]WNV79708.1 hypothetical protein RUL31_20575 [Bacillus atrophaeus]